MSVVSSGCGLWWLNRALVFGCADSQRGGAAVAGGGGGAAHDGRRGEPDAGDRAAHEHAARSPGGAGHHPRRYRRYGRQLPVAALLATFPYLLRGFG